MATVLFLSHREHACGIQQWGKRAAKVLSRAQKHLFEYREVESEDEFRGFVSAINPDIIIYNYHISTMTWLNPILLDEFRSRKQTVIIHEGFAHPENEHSFDYYVYIDPEIELDSKWSHKVFKVGRTLLEYSGEYKNNTIPTIGSFGFGFANKQYEHIVRSVNNEFDDAIINLLIPFAKFGDSSGDAARLSVDRCRAEIHKPGIKLNVSHEFLPEESVLEFLAGNDINAFFYADMPGRGISSAVDYALSVKRPMILTNTYMFRHINNHISHSISIETSSIKQVMSYGIEPLKPFYELWSNENFISAFEGVVDAILK